MLGLAAIALAGAAGLGAAAEAPRAATSDARDRKSVSLTLYQQGFGLVREVRRVALGRGRLELAVQDVPATLEPQTVDLRPAAAGAAVKVLAQHYRSELLSHASLLERYVGRTVRLHRWNEQTGQEQVVDATLLATAGEPVLRIGEEIVVGAPGWLGFPDGAQGLAPRPELAFELESEVADAELELAYLAGGLGWQADYVLVQREGGRADLSGAVTLANESGAEFSNARVRLVAGAVRRVSGGAPQPAHYAKGRAMEMSVAVDMPQEQAFSEYHLYDLEHSATLRRGERTQLALLDARGVEARERLRLEAEPHLYRAQLPEPLAPQAVSLVLELDNAKAAGLGRPLPAGVVRAYRVDAAGSAEFVGEDSIDHTPRDERLRLRVGQAFDVVARRLQTDYRVLGRCSAETAWSIELANRKTSAVEVDVVERVEGDWEMVESSLPAEKEGASSFRLRAPVPAGDETTVSYRVRVRWC
jgi:hypothetical protein